MDGGLETRPSQPRTEDDWSAIFVHAGAGFHSVQNEPSHLEACSAACRAAMVFLRNGGSAVDGVEMALKSLEDNEITNSGYGSNLSLDGTVECDASIMEDTGRSGAVGAVDRFKNPSALARLVLDNTRRPMSLKRVPPVMLVGPGAQSYAKEHRFPLVDNEALISRNAHARWVKWKRELDAYGIRHKEHKKTPRSKVTGVTLTAAALSAKSELDAEIEKTGQRDATEDVVTDTVGAICVDRWGRVAAGSSSGGIGMKHRGRIGPAALIGIGTWIRVEDGVVVAATCSGTGEQMAHTLIASKAVDRMFNSDDESQGLKTSIEKDFMGLINPTTPQPHNCQISINLISIGSKIVQESTMSSAVGIMAIKIDKNSEGKRIYFTYGHTTDSMAMAHMTTSMIEPETVMSRNARNPKTCLGGKVVRLP